MDGTTVVLVRHGESVAQEEGFLSGHDTCKGLSVRGRRQVEALRDRLRGTGELSSAAALYASVLPRAVETAQILAPALGDLEVRTDCGFCEAHVGDAEGRPYAEVQDVWTADDWDADHRPIAGWETWLEMAVRVTQAIDDTVARHPGELVVIACHGGVIAQAMQRWLGLDPRDLTQRAWFAPVNSSLTEFRGAASPWRGNGLAVELVRFNDHAHLAGTDLL